MSSLPAGLTGAEISALLSAIQEGQVGAAIAEELRAAPYDLTSPDRIIRGQMPTLDAFNEQIANAFAMGLAGRTRMSLRAAAHPSTMLKFVDLSQMLAPPVNVCVLSLGQGFGHALLVFEAGVAEALLAAALGDRKQKKSADDRPGMTSVEQLVVRRLLSVFTDAMTAAWAPVIPFRPEALRFESDPRMASVAPPNEVAIVSSFEVSGDLEGRFRLVIPYAAVEPVRARLSSPPRMSGPSAGRFTEALAREVAQVQVELRGVLGRARPSLSALTELKVGDVLVLDAEEGAPLPIYVQGLPKLAGSPKVFGGSMALVVEGPLGASTPRRKEA